MAISHDKFHECAEFLTAALDGENIHFVLLLSKDNEDEKCLDLASASSMPNEQIESFIRLFLAAQTIDSGEVDLTPSPQFKH